MKIIHGKILVAAMLLVAMCGQVFAAASVQQGIDNILRRYDPNLSTGIYVQSLTTGQTLYQKTPNQLFMPASTLKIFTAAAALSYLGPEFHFQTKVFASSSAISHGTLRGDLYFYFDGDPTLTRDDVAGLVAALKQQGITAVAGNIYIDDSIFDQEVFGPGWMWDERNFCYASPTSAITLDKNCFPFQITPAKRENQPARVEINHNYSFLPIVSHVVSAYSSYDDCPLDLRATSTNSYYLTGCVKPGARTIGMQIAIRNVRLYAQDVLTAELQHQNIKLQGEVKFERVPNSSALATLVIHNSAPLKDLVKTMLKKSDNLIADALYKKLGNVVSHKPATWRNSAKAVAAVLSGNTGINFKKMRMVDGSGLSRYNLISPAQLVAVLRYANRDTKIQQAFISALPKAGIDGTLKYRMSKVVGRVQAKTGSMASISALAGYVETNSRQKIAFAIITNDFLSKPAKYHKMQDQICTFLAGM